MRTQLTNAGPKVVAVWALLCWGLGGCTTVGQVGESGPGPETAPPGDAAPDAPRPGDARPEAAAEAAVDAAADGAADAAADALAEAAPDADAAADAAADAVAEAAPDADAHAGNDAVTDADAAADAATDADAVAEAAAGDLGPVGDVFPAPPDGASDGSQFGDGPLYGCGPAPAVGCCRGDELYYCAGGALVRVDCTASPKCGWDPAYAQYDCATDGKADPAGAHPLVCPF